MFFEGSISLQERGPDVIPFSFDTIGDGSAGQVEISLSRSYTRALANSGAYRFDWFVYHGRERIRLVAGRISAQGSSTGASTGVPIPSFGSSPSVAWGNITGTLSNQTDLQAALDAISSGASTFAELTDKATANLPAINTPLSSALSGKQPLDADLTAIAALTTTANGRALLTSANALTIGASASVSGTNTGDQDLSGLLPRLSSITVTGTTPAFPGPLVEQPSLLNGKRRWAGTDSSIEFDGYDWVVQYSDGAVSYYASYNDPTTDEPWKIAPATWGISLGTGQPTLQIDPPTLVPVTPFTGTIALAADQYGRLSPTDMIDLGAYVSNALAVGADTNGGFLTAGTGGTLPITRGGTGATTTPLARTALGSSATGDALFTALNPAAARTTLELGAFSVNGSITGTGALTFTAGGSNQNITITPSGSGVVTISSASAFLNISTSAGEFGGFRLQESGSDRWTFAKSDSTDDLIISRFNTSGVFQNNPFAISIATGVVSMAGTTASTTTTTGALVVAGGVGIAGAVNAGSLALTAPLPITSGGTGATTAPLARTALGSGATGDQLFTAGSPAVANTLLANNVVTKAADFTLAEADAGTYMRLTKTGSPQTITLPTSGISTGAEFQFYRATTQSLAFSGGTVNGTANLASVPNNGAFALKHLGSGTYDFI
jgi:hypothetical protein